MDNQSSCASIAEKIIECRSDFWTQCQMFWASCKP